MYPEDMEWGAVVAEANGRQERDNCIPIFKTRVVEDKKATNETGHACFKEVEYVEIIIPGDKNQRPEKKVTQEHIDRWPAQYAKFKAGKEEALDGTPIEQWPRINRALAAELKLLGFLTVESLANAGDGQIEGVRDGRRLREAAQLFLKPDDVKVADLKAENQALKTQIAQIQSQLDQLQNADQPKRGPGRPRKEAA